MYVSERPHKDGRACVFVYLSTSGEVLECWESCDVQRVHLIGCSVQLGDDDVISVGILFPQFLPDGSQFLTVATPRSVYTHTDTLERCILLLEMIHTCALIGCEGTRAGGRGWDACVDLLLVHAVLD